MMKVSIVVPVFNLEREITGTLDSIFAQTYYDIEVLAIDDGSTDQTPAILDKYANSEPRLRVIHKKNEGVLKTRMVGVARATGDYIGFVDGDDRVDADMFECLMKNAASENADISQCGYRLIHGNMVTNFYNTGERLVQDGTQATKALLEGTRIEPSLCTKVFRAKLCEQLLQEEALDYSVQNNEDLLLNYYLFRKAKTVVYEDICPYQYLVRQQSASKSKGNLRLLTDPVKAARRIYSDAKAEPQLRTVAERLYLTKLMRAATFYGTSDQATAEMRRGAQKELRSVVMHYLINREERILRRAQALFAALLPRLYDIVHQRYLRKQET